ncbi:MAG: ATP-binding protein [Coriobacteriia bacterium]|nr:ATP-binding protein [Coriobacteriia bacterium]
MKLIKRKDYLEEITDVINTPDIKIVTGVRRSGKSKLLEEIIKYIKLEDKNANIIHINFNLTKYEDLQDYHKLEDTIESKFHNNVNNYIFIDEVQMCKDFEKAINSLHAKEKFDIYISGSNAFLQSSDLATLFVGRAYEIHVFPFSFNEYSTYFPNENNYQNLTNYMTDGGMSGSYLYKNKSRRMKYLNEEVLNALIIRDIVNKYRIRNEQLLNLLVDYLMDNIGNLTSLRKIQNTLASNGIKADHKTIGKYIDYLCKAFAFYKVRRYDIRGKKYLNKEEKYYLSDHSFKYARLGTRNLDYGRILENIIAVELLRRNYEVYVGKLYKTEVDFVAIKQNQKLYIQVSNDISDEKTLNRELKPLLNIKDGYKKILIARIYQPKYEIDGIEIIDPSEWLLNLGSKKTLQ